MQYTDLLQPCCEWPKYSLDLLMQHCCPVDIPWAWNTPVDKSHDWIQLAQLQMERKPTGNYEKVHPVYFLLPVALLGLSVKCMSLWKRWRCCLPSTFLKVYQEVETMSPNVQISCLREFPFQRLSSECATRLSRCPEGSSSIRFRGSRKIAA